MAGQTSTFKIDSQVTVPFREGTEIELEVVFETEQSASLTLSNVTFVDSETGKNATKLRTLQQLTPLEGVDVSVQIADLFSNDFFSFDFFTNWNDFNFLADNEVTIRLEKLNSVISFDERAKAVTFTLLEYKNLLNNADYQNIPYVVENRKTLLEKIQLLATTWGVIKAAADEVHKIINIASDITSAGILQAILNLAVTITAIILLIDQLISLFEDIMDSFFPIVLYHSGIKPKVFIEKAVEYLELDGVEFGDITQGSFGWIMERWALCPSKNDEKGIPVDFINISGALKSKDVGYNLFDMIEVMKNKFNIKRGIINNVLHLRPESDPFWTLSPGSTAPDVLVEQGFTDNGTSHYNYEDFFSNTLMEYATDDTDYWTNQDLANMSDPNTSNKILAGVIVEPVTVTSQKRVISNQGKKIDIPYTLCTRKDTLQDLLDTFLGTASELSTFKQMITERFDQFVDVLETSVPSMGSLLGSFGGRTGVMKVENHFFNVAKSVFLEDTNIGFSIAPRIPVNFGSYLGARSLIDNFHNYNSFVPGIRDPNDLADTNAKLVFVDVKMPFNISKFAGVVNNPYFNIPGGGKGKYTSLKWNQKGGFAIANYWIEKNWMQNIEQISI